MSKRKRDSGDTAADEEPHDLQILVAGIADPLTAHRDLLKFHSSLVKNMPAARGGKITVWDLRNVVLEGDTSPVDSAVVQTWLDFIYSRLDGSRGGRLPSRLSDVVRLLAFADFVGACRGDLQEMGSRIAADSALFLELSVGELLQQQQQQEQQEQPRVIKIQLHDAVYYYSTHGITEMKAESKLLVFAADMGPHTARFTTAISTAVEAALFVAARLKLVPLVRTLRAFAMTQLLPCYASNMILTPHIVYSARVLRNMPHEVLCEGFLEGTLANSPYHVQLRGGGELSGVRVSPLVAMWLTNSPGEEVAGLRIGQQPRVGSVLETNATPRAWLRLNVTLGGMGAEGREAEVRRALSQLEEAGGAV